MGACDGHRRLIPVAPAVGDRPSIGDEAHPRQSAGRDQAEPTTVEYRAPSVTPALRSIILDSLRMREKPDTIGNRHNTHSHSGTGRLNDVG